jgi:N-alpha-acetyltransferase 35, NatC auxiliary subunit
VPKAALLWRLESLREVVLSGFGLELYAPQEKPFAYWFLSNVIKIHIKVLDEVDGAVPSGMFYNYCLYECNMLRVCE